MTLIKHWGRWAPTKQNRTLHPHKNAGLEIIYVARGEIEWIYGGKSVKNTPGSFVISWPWEEHGIPSGTVPQVEIYWVLIRLNKPYPLPVSHPELPDELNMDPDTERQVIQGLRNTSLRSPRASDLSGNLLKGLVHEMQEPTLGHSARIRHMLSLLLLELCRLYTHPVFEHETLGNEQKVIAFIQNLKPRCDEEWTLDRMAVSCGLGRTRFAHLVSQHTGDSPLRLLNRYRIHKAQTLLRDSSYSITTIGFECGYESSQYFARVFKEFTQRTPSEWRNQPRD